MPEPKLKRLKRIGHKKRKRPNKKRTGATPYLDLSAEESGEQSADIYSQTDNYDAHEDLKTADDDGFISEHDDELDRIRARKSRKAILKWLFADEQLNALRSFESTTLDARKWIQFLSDTAWISQLWSNASEAEKTALVDRGSLASLFDFYPSRLPDRLRRVMVKTRLFQTWLVKHKLQLPELTDPAAGKPRT